MGSEGLIILPVAQRGALIVEGSEGAIEDIERGEFLFLHSTCERRDESEAENAETRSESKSAHADGTYLGWSRLMPRCVTR